MARKVGGEAASQAFDARSALHVSGEDTSGGDGDGGVDVRVGQEHGVDFGGFDADAVDLHLIVGAAHVIELPVCVDPHQVTRAIQPVAGSTERIGHESYCGIGASVTVAASESAAAHIQLPDGAGRNGVQPRIEDVGGGTRDRDSDARLPTTRSGPATDTPTVSSVGPYPLNTRCALHLSTSAAGSDSPAATRVSGANSGDRVASTVGVRFAWVMR